MTVRLRILPVLISLFLAACQSSSAPLDFKGNTIAFYDGRHGIQIEYYASNGRSYLWYPGNTRTLQGRWQKREADGKVCFKYPSYARNPVENKRLGDWNCKSASSLKAAQRFTCSGDVYNLSSGKIPFVLEKGRGQLAQLKRACQ